jgi:hypothetical protein
VDRIHFKSIDTSSSVGKDRKNLWKMAVLKHKCIKILQEEKKIYGHHMQSSSISRIHLTSCNSSSAKDERPPMEDTPLTQQ